MSAENNYEDHGVRNYGSEIMNKSKVSNSVEKYISKNKTGPNFNSNRTSSNRINNYKNREANLSFHKISSKIAKKKFYDNILASGGKQLINFSEMKSNIEPSYTVSSGNKNLFSNQKIDSDKIDCMIPIFNKNKKFIESSSRASKARKTFRKFE